MHARLRAFVTIADNRGFGPAARSLSITQPALTKQIQALERELGGTLFTRGRHGASLTDFGEALLPQARDVVAAVDDFTHRAHRLSRGEHGSLALGFGLSAIDIAPRAVAAFRQSYPDVEVGLEDLPSAVQADRIRTGQLHAGFVRLPVGDDLHQRALRRDHLVVASSTPVPREVIGWLGGQRLVRLARIKGPGLAAQIDRLCAARQIRPGTLHETHDLQTVLALVAAGVGPALVPATAARIAPPGIAFTALRDPEATWDVGIAWHPVQHTALVDNFVASVLAPEPTA
ncbi:DNA-binding transcriptional regulator, LysR family [Saccharopolyspora antimicrobica]|uniref:DNA-binding transcriptional LysR family regulator n=1 Tax=Saccharopolyspora antimicrobica TaxID=455193 RepID=A0A1I4S2E2_9PSEU|nr:LysR family transcriptional regulator [Saccharopolyspora antimicrobica]RKT87557.1 DNA-binding transcriptional LysR family regulator [Saccharopolyspora antimicrobica]SFM58687.1 DNA-binding transcriptional regulator, LysR family [Saccharopolyspora antimicrobica]